MRLQTILFSSLLALSAAACHKDTRLETGNTGDSSQPAPTGDKNQIGTRPTVATGTGGAGISAMGEPDQGGGSTGYGPRIDTTRPDQSDQTAKTAKTAEAAKTEKTAKTAKTAKQAQNVDANGNDLSIGRDTNNATDRGDTTAWGEATGQQRTGTLQ